MCNEAIWMENQYFDNLPLDSSRQVGNQFLISDSPQARSGRIGKWASGNLQPCKSTRPYNPNENILTNKEEMIS